MACFRTPLRAWAIDPTYDVKHFCVAKLTKETEFPAQLRLDALAGMVVAPIVLPNESWIWSVVDKRRRTDALDNICNSFGVVAAWSCEQLYSGWFHSHTVSARTSGAAY